MASFSDPDAHVSGWTRLPTEDLQSTLEALYWESVTRELGTVILSLKHLKNVPLVPEEEDIMKRLPSKPAYFAGTWAPFHLNEQDTEGLWECAAMDMTERQQLDVHFRRARMLLVGLGLLDINRLIEFRDAPMRSLEGTVQVNIARIPAADGQPQLLVHTLGCCECRRPIRTHFFSCSEVCTHHDKDGHDTICAFLEHQYNVCVKCYQDCAHAKQHLKKIRPYNPLINDIVEGMDEATVRRLSRDVKRLQDHEDKREAGKDGQQALRLLLRAAPEVARRRMLPFGNVHASVMFGPLVFEIGAPRSQGGALITHRQTPDLAYSEVWKFVDSEVTTPAVAVSPDKKVFTCVQKVEPRRFHAATTQVLGGLFSGHNPRWRDAEHGVIDCLLAEGEQYVEKPGKSQKYNNSRRMEAASRITAILKANFGDEVASYLRHFTARLLDPGVNLKLDQLRLANNCQTFCQNLLQGPDRPFETITPRIMPVRAPAGTTPRYLLSFVSDQSRSMYDFQMFHITPSAAYLAEFHIAEDIVEYFETWPDIPKDNACAKLLCWPCQDDGKCSISEHMWQMPHEMTSLTMFHVLRDRDRYRYGYTTTDPREDEPTFLTDGDWFQSRLRVLGGLDSFLVSAGAIVASYQMFPEVISDLGESKVWKPALAKEAGMFFRPGIEEEGTRNFFIQNARNSILPSWSSEERAFGKHIRHQNRAKGLGSH